MIESFCKIIDDIIKNNKTTIKILWISIIILSSSCLGAGIKGMLYEETNINMILFGLGFLGTSTAVIIYFLKVIFACHDTVN